MSGSLMAAFGLSRKASPSVILGATQDEDQSDLNRAPIRINQTDGVTQSG